MAQIRQPFDAMHMSNTTAYEVQRTNHFEVQIINVGGTDLTFAVNSSSLPTINVDQIELSYGNTNVKVAGAVTVDNIDVEVKDFIEPDLQTIIEEWRMEVYNQHTGDLGWAADYKRDGVLYIYSPSGDVKRAWRLKGTWPTSVSFGDLNYDGSDALTISMTLSVDQAYIIGTS